MQPPNVAGSQSAVVNQVADNENLRQPRTGIKSKMAVDRCTGDQIQHCKHCKHKISPPETICRNY